MSEITAETACECGHTFREHSGFHDNGLGGDGTWVDFGCDFCECKQFGPEADGGAVKTEG